MGERPLGQADLGAGYDAHQRWFKPRFMGEIFLQASHGVRRTSATIPRSGMADTYGCPIENLPKLHRRFYTYCSFPHSLKTTQWP